MVRKIKILTHKHFTFNQSYHRNLTKKIFQTIIQKIEELRKGPKGPQCNSDFISKIEGRSNTAFFQPNRLDQSELGEYPTMNN